MRTPTVLQFARLLSLARGGIILSPRRAEWAPLLRRGWVERCPDLPGTPRGGLLPPLQITPDGYRALAAALERHGWIREWLAAASHMGQEGRS